MQNQLALPERNIQPKGDDLKREEIFVPAGEIGYRLDKGNHGWEYICLNNECPRSRMRLRAGTDLFKNVIGIKGAPYADAGRDKAVICRCSNPACQSIYWFHVEDKTASKFKEKFVHN